MTLMDRALEALDARPTVIDARRIDGQTIRLTLSFRGCDDDAFEICADLLSICFWDEREPPEIVNPEAVGDPDQTPVVQL